MSEKCTGQPGGLANPDRHQHTPAHNFGPGATRKIQGRAAFPHRLDVSREIFKLFSLFGSSRLLIFGNEYAGCTMSLPKELVIRIKIGV
jgi:hypothetical protein